MWALRRVKWKKWNKSSFGKFRKYFYRFPLSTCLITSMTPTSVECHYKKPILIKIFVRSKWQNWNKNIFLWCVSRSYCKNSLWSNLKLQQRPHQKFLSFLSDSSHRQRKILHRIETFNLLNANPTKWSNTLKQVFLTILWGWRLTL